MTRYLCLALAMAALAGTFPAPSHAADADVMRELRDRGRRVRAPSGARAGGIHGPPSGKIALFHIDFYLFHMRVAGRHAEVGGVRGRAPDPGGERGARASDGSGGRTGGGGEMHGGGARRR